MKKCLLILLAFTFSTCCLNAQNKISNWNIGLFVATPDQRTYKPYIDSWIDLYMGKASSNTTEMRWPIIGVQGSYCFKNNMILRIKYGISAINYNSQGNWIPDSTVNSLVKSSMKQVNHFLSFGVLYKVELSKISLNIGAEAIFNRYGKGNLNYFEDYKGFTNGLLDYNMITEENWITAKGYSVGIAPITEINFNLKNFSLGCEISIPFLFRNFGDDIERSILTDVITGNVYENKQITDIHYKTLKFDKIRAAVSLSYWF